MPEYLPPTNFGPATELFNQANQYQVERGQFYPLVNFLSPILQQAARSGTMPNDLLKGILGNFTKSFGASSGQQMGSGQMASTGGGGGDSGGDSGGIGAGGMAAIASLF